MGILNEKVPHDSPFFGIPNPGTFILDAKGNIKAKYFEEDFRERFTAADILTRQFGVAPSAGRHEVIGKQLNAVASASNFVVRGGQRVALALDIDLKPKMHVYAPGVEGYIPIEWKMKDSAAFTAHEVTLPPSKMLHLPAIDETVPVYAGHFRIVRDITIAAGTKLKPLASTAGGIFGGGNITISGLRRSHMLRAPGAAHEVDVSARGARSRAGARGVAEESPLGSLAFQNALSKKNFFSAPESSLIL